MGLVSFKRVFGQQPVESPQVRHRNLYTAGRLALLFDVDG